MHDCRLVQVIFCTRYHVHHLNHVLCISGSSPELGSWEEMGTVPMELCSSDKRWQCRVTMASCQYVKWKMAIKDIKTNHIVERELISDRQLKIRADSDTIIVFSLWNMNEHVGQIIGKCDDCLHVYGNRHFEFMDPYGVDRYRFACLKYPGPIDFEDYTVVLEAKINVTITANMHVDSNHILGVVGSVLDLGDWNPKDAVLLDRQSESGYKFGSAALLVGELIEWKLVLLERRSKHLICMESCKNHITFVKPNLVEIRAEWNSPECLRHSLCNCLSEWCMVHLAKRCSGGRLLNLGLINEKSPNKGDELSDVHHEMYDRPNTHISGGVASSPHTCDYIVWPDIAWTRSRDLGGQPLPPSGHWVCETTRTEMLSDAGPQRETMATFKEGPTVSVVVKNGIVRINDRCSSNSNQNITHEHGHARLFTLLNAGNEVSNSTNHLKVALSSSGVCYGEMDDQNVDSPCNSTSGPSCDLCTENKYPDALLSAARSTSLPKRLKVDVDPMVSTRRVDSDIWHNGGHMQSVCRSIQTRHSCTGRALLYGLVLIAGTLLMGIVGLQTCGVSLITMIHAVSLCCFHDYD